MNKSHKSLLFFLGIVLLAAIFIAPYSHIDKDSAGKIFQERGGQTLFLKLLFSKNLSLSDLLLKKWITQIAAVFFVSLFFYLSFAWIPKKHHKFTIPALAVIYIILNYLLLTSESFVHFEKAGSIGYVPKTESLAQFLIFILSSFLVSYFIGILLILIFMFFHNLFRPSEALSMTSRTFDDVIFGILSGSICVYLLIFIIW